MFWILRRTGAANFFTSINSNYSSKSNTNNNNNFGKFLPLFASSYCFPIRIFFLFSFVAIALSSIHNPWMQVLIGTEIRKLLANAVAHMGRARGEAHGLMWRVGKHCRKETGVKFLFDFKSLGRIERPTVVDNNCTRKHNTYWCWMADTSNNNDAHTITCNIRGPMNNREECVCKKWQKLPMVARLTAALGSLFVAQPIFTSTPRRNESMRMEYFRVRFACHTTR